MENIGKFSVARFMKIISISDINESKWAATNWISFQRANVIVWLNHRHKLIKNEFSYDQIRSIRLLLNIQSNQIQSALSIPVEYETNRTNMNSIIWKLNRMKLYSIIRYQVNRIRNRFTINRIVYQFQLEKMREINSLKIFKLKDFNQIRSS